MAEVRNTAAADPVEKLFTVLPGGIEAQEARGQRELVNSTVLPYSQDRDDEPFVKLGFAFGDPVEGDDLFREATLPEGWSRGGTDHAMWSHILDDRGFRRVAIFYKAAFYDRRADMHLVREPETKAQADTYDAFDAWCPWNGGWTHDLHKDGDNLVRVARECVVEDGSNVYDHEAHDWKRTGRTRERVIAPDGSTVSQREFEA